MGQGSRWGSLLCGQDGDAGLGHFWLQVTPEIIWVTREEMGCHEEQPRGRDATWTSVRAGTGVLARAGPSPKARREAWPGSALGSQRQIRPNPHPQGLTNLRETDIGHNHNLWRGSHKAWQGLRGPWGDRRSNRGIIMPESSAAGPSGPSAFHGILAIAVPILQMRWGKTKWVVRGLTDLTMPRHLGRGVLGSDP